MPLEVEICLCAANLSSDGTEEFHGYDLARHIASNSGRQSLTAYGTLYRALGRLVDMGMLTSRWEDPSAAADENRPRRRFYSLTTAGRAAAREAVTAKAAKAKRLRKGWAPA
ncbi:MAG: PadR family transcriptional regulator [Vicinamibacterales bacterium]